MAEFGENIKRAREEKGFTQQTIANKLYVSRQAVSRWENGSRYPDLLTAKSLAAALDTNLDKLLSNDDMQNYPEVNPVIEYPLYKRVQTALFSAAFVTNLVQLLWYFFFNLTENRALQTDYEAALQIYFAISSGLITVVLLFGSVKSIKDTINPRAAAEIAVMLIGVDILDILVEQYLNWLNNSLVSVWSITLNAVIDASFIIFVLLFFIGKKPRRPITVYICAGLVIIRISGAYISNLISVSGTPGLTKYLITSSLRLFALLLIPILIIYMAATLYRKRQLTRSCLDGENYPQKVK